MLQRHQLAWLGDAGWQQVRAAEWDAQARECIEHWIAHRLPWVVTRQRSAERLALGLAAPMHFGRRRLAIEVRHDEASHFGAFPLAKAAATLLAPSARAQWLTLCDELRELGCSAQIYGSHGWELLTGMTCTHADSDFDLLLPVHDDAAADAVCAAMASASIAGPRLDGELLFAGGAGIAWREWPQWRSGRARQVLVKRIDGAALEARPATVEIGSC